ncbi:uncharacterized protein LOC131805590 [Musca domestica]|uniref:Uncharacterized protein LOC131805590 n=1 Tax=Musca domestica TaxID=7370 RepID=A0ABM3VGH9_MUSDO|nr:uncharacterized protein LOC131805590 [Musca domestica]
MFPTEREEFYRTGRRGRIYNKVSNLKRVYKRIRQHTADASLDVSGPSSPESTNVIKEEEYVDEFADFHILDMRKHIQSNEERMSFWQRTQSTRFRDIEIIESLQDILDKWPEYKRTDAMEYINADFRAKFPKATKFSEIFLKNFKKLEKISYLKVNTTSPSFKYMQQYKHCNTESKHLIILWVLHQLVPPFHQVVIDENGVRRKKRYTTLESQNASICIRSSLAELEEAMKLRQTATPPMMLVVGELGGDIRESYVYFEEMYLPCQTVLQAAELCMELYFLFNLAFPEESVLYYNFAQSLFLNIPTEMKHSRIYTTINEIEACEV